ncbi:MAG TPA: alpha-L-rhamnosidase C-terminal domain-containing protein, partial [Saprospiraceae bacterium]|nr:alpha-L-rhamnosidase C-terminal domain-containing protein [Saprospiraceae bacterium]
LIAQCFYIHSTQLLVNAARELGKTDDVATYSALLEKIKQAYWNEYVTPNGRLVSPTQTACVLALQFDLLPETKRDQAVQFLVNNIHAYNDHLTTGFLGTPYLCHVLTRYGQNDLAYTLLNQKTYPSWLYPVTMGATTIWERWDGIRPDSSFEEASMNSFNHYAYGAIGDWLYRNVAGINPADDAVAYKKIVIRPRPGGGLSRAEATLASGYGPIRSSWQLEENRFSLEADIPANTTATIFIPAANLENVLESGRPLTQSPGLELLGMQEGCVVVKAGSGRYRFTVRS